MQGAMTKCPKCGGEIEISFLYQYSHNHTITKSGRISKKYTKKDCGPMEVGLAQCLSCGADWGDGEFTIEDGYFVDLKYGQ